MKMRVPTKVQALFLSVVLGPLVGCVKDVVPAIHLRTVSASEIPSTVLTSFQEKFPSSSIVWIGALGSGTNVAYSIQFTQAGKSLAVWLDTFGRLGSANELFPANPNR